MENWERWMWQVILLHGLLLAAPGDNFAGNIMSILLDMASEGLSRAINHFLSSLFYF